MSSVAKDIADLLAADSDVALTFATDLFVGRIPDSPIVATAIIPTAGRPSSDNRQIEYDRHMVEIVSRGTNYETTDALMRSIKSLLVNTSNTTINGSKYTVFTCMVPVYLLAYSENNHPIFSMIFEVQRQTAI